MAFIGKKFLFMIAFAFLGTAIFYYLLSRHDIELKFTSTASDGNHQIIIEQWFSQFSGAVPIEKVFITH